jgi:HlyD family secretion protein
MKKGLKRVLVVLVLLAVLGGGGYYVYEHYIKAQPPTLQLVTAMVSKGSVVQGIDATGRLQAVTTVQVGSQVSGTIKSLYADFNSQVKKGQVVASWSRRSSRRRSSRRRRPSCAARPTSSARVCSSRTRN